MERIDYNCFVGNWPFYRVRNNSITKIHDLHTSVGISGGYLSSLESVFYQDPYESESQLAEMIQGYPYRQAMVLNPMIPSWKDTAELILNRYPIAAIRIIPSIHHFLPTDPIMDLVAEALVKWNLPLIISMRMEDERIEWLIHSTPVPPDALTAFLMKYSEITTWISYARVHELSSLSKVFRTRANLFADVCGLKDGEDPIGTAASAIGAEHLIYGSQAPLLEIHSTVQMVMHSPGGIQYADDIFSGQLLTETLRSSLKNDSKGAVL